MIITSLIFIIAAEGLIPAAAKDWTPFLLVSNAISPILSALAAYLLTRRKTVSEINVTDASAHKTDTESNLLKIDKLIELTELIETAQTKYLDLKEQFGELDDKFDDFKYLSNRIFDIVNEISCDDPRLGDVQIRIKMLREKYPNLG